MDRSFCGRHEVTCQANKAGRETARRPRIVFFGATGARITGRRKLTGHNAVISLEGSNNGIDDREN
jgi:hypothetical protein